ncbi:MAG: tRNA adenosine(34) deaminase TadA [Eubacteriales bacterium]|nr:tRNA adenosine(34) deaminase TadA [Eubacteriales bacterium]MDD4390263.1 tRNA adenosine(34) deaminase TadA [Eubacteriales bacterium]
MKNFMLDALAEAEQAAAMGEIPIGAVVVKDCEIIGRGHNMTEASKDPTAHAEILAIKAAAQKLGGWRLLDCDMYVTCEPCSMCAGAMVWARIKRVYIGTPDPKSGACGSVFNIVDSEKLNHRVEIETGLMQKECEALLKKFFKELREKKSEELHL